MDNPRFSRHLHFRLPTFIGLYLCLVLLAACATSATSTNIGSTPRPTVRQVLVFPNVGIQDLATLDPAQASDENSLQAMMMIYSGLVRLDQKLSVFPGQAPSTISPDRKVYTFFWKPGFTSPAGTPLTAQGNLYSLT